MKTLAPILLVVTSLSTSAFAADGTKTLTLDAQGLKSLRIDADAGDLVIEGSGGSTIEVVATIHGDERDFRLSLTKNGTQAVLLSKDDDSFLSWAFNWTRIDLKVKVPSGLQLDIDDGAGDLVMTGVVGNAEIEDGSGEIVIKNHSGDLDIDDGSGSIEIIGVVGNVKVEDGSGSMRIENIDGHVTIDDGSGSITVNSVKKGLTILDAGSGGLSTKKIEGGIEHRD